MMKVAALHQAWRSGKAPTSRLPASERTLYSAVALASPSPMARAALDWAAIPAQPFCHVPYATGRECPLPPSRTKLQIAWETALVTNFYDRCASESASL